MGAWKGYMGICFIAESCLAYPKYTGMECIKMKGVNARFKLPGTVTFIRVQLQRNSRRRIKIPSTFFHSVMSINESRSQMINLQLRTGKSGYNIIPSP